MAGFFVAMQKRGGSSTGSVHRLAIVFSLTSRY